MQMKLCLSLITPILILSTLFASEMDDPNHGHGDVHQDSLQRSRNDSVITQADGNEDDGHGDLHQEPSQTCKSHL